MASVKVIESLLKNTLWSARTETELQTHRWAIKGGARKWVHRGALTLQAAEAIILHNSLLLSHRYCLKECKFTKGGLISESFLLWIKSPKIGARSLLWSSSLFVDGGQDSDLALILGRFEPKWKTIWDSPFSKVQTNRQILSNFVTFLENLTLTMCINSSQD